MPDDSLEILLPEDDLDLEKEIFDVPEDAANQDLDRVKKKKNKRGKRKKAR